MEMKYRNYPYPVLAYYSDNFVKCSFQVSMIPSKTKTEYILNVTAKTSCKDLTNLIKQGKAFYAVYAECSPTMFRRLYTSFEESFSINIPSSEVDGKVQLCPYILAAEDINDYTSTDFHPDYNGIKFKVKKGDVLALDRDKDFDAMKEEDVLRNISSIFSIQRAKEANAPSQTVDIMGHKITIYLSHKNFEIYNNIRKDSNLQKVLTTVIVIPALVHIVDIVKGSDFNVGEYEDKRWFRSLKRRLTELGLDIDNPDSLEGSLAIAHKLIGDPITDALNSIAEFSNDSE